MSAIGDFFRSRKSARGFWRAVRNLANELVMLRRHWRGLRRARAYRGQRGLKLNLGCGKNNRPGWVNIDLCSRGPDVQLDLREPLPFDDGSVALIYNEHFFEHLSFPEDINRLLASFIRVLEPGGVLSMGMPDAEAGLRAYVEDNGKKLRVTEAHWFPVWCDSPMHKVNYLFRQINEHQYAWDFETLTNVLQKAGFVDVERREWDSSLDSPAWKGTDTLYVKARKPSDAAGGVS